MKHIIKKVWQSIGVLAFWVSWPALWFYLRGTVRTRVLITYNNEVLVVKNWLGDGKWSLPGGGMHRSETAEVGARREVSEELNIQASQLRLKPLITEQHLGTNGGHGFVFLCHYFTAVCTRRPAIRPQKLEIIDYAWLAPGQLTTATASNDVLRALELTA